MSGFLDGKWRSQAGGRFLNRYDAGRAVAAAIREKLVTWRGNGVVVGLPRGGIIVARAVANDLKLPLDFRAVRKVGHPYHQEFAIGAVDISGVAVRNRDIPVSDMPSEIEFDQMVQKALMRAKEMDLELRQGKASIIPSADWCLVVDDGAATGLTVIAVVEGLKKEGKTVHVAVPVASDQAQHIISRAADSFTAIHVPEWFMAVSQFYEDFGEVTTEQARNAL
jgi:predicted phosphoribosyltransferase